MEIKKSMNFQNETEFVSFLINYIKENPSKIGILLFNDIEIDKYNMILKSQDIQVITGNNQNIYDEECIDFIKSLANLSKNGALIKAMNFPSNIIDDEKYQEYRRTHKDARADWKVLEDNESLIINITEYNRKREYIKKYFTVKHLNIHDELIEIERVFSMVEQFNGYQKLQFTSLINFATHYDQSDNLDTLSDFISKYERQDLLKLQESSSYIVLSTPKNPIDLSYDILALPNINIDENKLRDYTISIKDIDDDRFKYSNLFNATTVTHIIYTDNLSTSLRTRLQSTSTVITVYTGNNTREVMQENKVYEELLERGVLTKTHQRWIDSIYSKYASNSKYRFFANEITELYKNLFDVILAFDKEETTFETSLGSIRVFLRFTLKIILDSVFDTKKENINHYLKAHTSSSKFQTRKTFTDSNDRISVIDTLKEKKIIKKSFSDQDFLNLSILSHFLDSAAHRGDRSRYRLEDEMRIKFKNLTKKDQLEILLSIFKFIYSIELSDKQLEKINNTMKNYFIFA